MDSRDKDGRTDLELAGLMSETGAAAGGAVPVAPPAPRRRAALGYAFYFPASLMFALNGTVSKQLLEGVDSVRLSQLRVTIAFVLLVIIVAVTRPRTLRLSRAEVPSLLFYGIAGLAVTQWLYFVSISRLPVGVALLIEFTAPVMVALWVRFAWHEQVRDRVWVALAMSVLGLAMVGQVWLGFSLDTIGVLAGVGAAATLAIYYVAGERAVRTRDPMSLTMWGFGVAALAWAIVAPWWSYPWAEIGAVHGEIGPLTDISGWWLVAYMVVFGTVVPFALVLFSLRHLSAAQGSTIGLAEPLLASAIAWIVLGEVLAPVQIIGGIVVLAGVLLAERSR